MSNLYKDIARIFTIDYKFGNKKQELEHWDKHKSEVPQQTPDEFLKYVDRESDRPIDGNVIVGYKRPNGEIIKYNRSTGWLFAINANRLKTGFPFHGGESRLRRKMEQENGTIIKWK